MTRLPVISGRKAVKCFTKLGYHVVLQTGSHIRLHHTHRKPLTIPDHKTLGRGLLRKIIRDAEITMEEFNKIL